MFRVPSISPLEAKEKLESSDNFIIVDVREDYELEFVSLNHSTEFKHIRMREIPQRMSELPKDKEIGVLCRSGARSAQVTQFLRQQGYSAFNINGGILLWSDQIDPSLRKYKTMNGRAFPL